MKRPKIHKKGLHKSKILNIKVNLKNDTIENADFHGVKIEETPYIDNWQDYAQLCKLIQLVLWCQILTFFIY